MAVNLEFNPSCGLAKKPQEGLFKVSAIFPLHSILCRVANLKCQHSKPSTVVSVELLIQSVSNLAPPQ